MCHRGPKPVTPRQVPRVFLCETPRAFGLAVRDHPICWFCKSLTFIVLFVVTKVVHPRCHSKAIIFLDIHAEVRESRVEGKHLHGRNGLRRNACMYGIGRAACAVIVGQI